MRTEYLQRLWVITFVRRHPPFGRTLCDTAGRNTKFLRVSVIGDPNSGKSTFVNQLACEKRSIVSSMRHTTRKEVRTVINIENTQLLVSDTPGVVSKSEIKQLRLSSEVFQTPHRVVKSSQLILYFKDASNRATRNFLSRETVSLLEEHSLLMPCVLVLNKVDAVPHKPDLLEAVSNLMQDVQLDSMGIPKALCGWSGFHKVFMISAKTGDGMVDLVQFLLKTAPNAPWVYEHQGNLDMTLQEKLVDLAKEKLMSMGNEVPFVVSVDLADIALDRTGSLSNVTVIFKCPRQSLVRYIEEHRTRIGFSLLQDLRSLFGPSVQLNVQVMKN